jgi:FimV-like protein
MTERVRCVSVVVLTFWMTVSALPLRADQDVVPVRSGDSLWKIADRIAPEAGLSRDQVMLALLESNPEAFSPACNVNGLLRMGAVLRVPSAERIGALDAETARLSIARQAREWADHRRTGRPLVCPPVDRGLPESPPTAAPEVIAEPIAEPRPESTATPPAEPVSTLSPPSAEVSPSPSEPPPAPVQGEPEASLSGVGTERPVAESACPCPAEAAGGASPSERPRVTLPAEGADEGAAPPLPEGPIAPAWLLVALTFAVFAAALIRRERRAAAAAATASGSAGDAGVDVATAPPRRVALLLAWRRGDLVLLLLAALSGLLGALVTVLFREGIHALERVLAGQSGSLVMMAESLPAWQRLLAPTAGGLVAGLILAQIGGRLRGRKTTDYMEAVAIGDGWISVRHSLVKSASSLVTVATGGSIGREGAMVQLAAMVASVVGRVARFPRDRMRLLVAAGAAAGLAAAYNAPIAATIFVAEIVLGSIALEFIGPLIVATVISSVTVHDIMGYAPVYEIPEFQLVSDWELGLYLLLGITAGHVAPVFLSLLGRSHRAFARMPLPLAARMAIGGLIVGAISVYEPAVWGNGYSVVNTVLNEPWVWQALLTVMVLKMLATAATHGSGAVGGAFTPTLFVGALLGVLFGTLVHAILPVGTAPPSAYAVVGMGAMLAGTTHAPLMAILMVFEMTMDYEIVLPLMLAVVTAHYTARQYSDISPLYAESLLPRETDAPR